MKNTVQTISGDIPCYTMKNLPDFTVKPLASAKGYKAKPGKQKVSDLSVCKTLKSHLG